MSDSEARQALSALVEAVGRGDEHGLAEAYRRAVDIVRQPVDPADYEYAVSLNLTPTVEGWSDLETARTVLLRWQEWGNIMGKKPGSFHLIRRNKVGKPEIFKED